MPEDYRPILLEQQVGRIAQLLQGATKVQITGADGYIYQVIGTPFGYRAADLGRLAGFTVVSRAINQVQYAGVVYKSSVYDGISPGHPVTVTGLLSGDSPDDSDAGWNAVSSETNVILDVPISGGAVSSAQIRFDTSDDIEGDAWSTGSVVEKDGNGNQTIARKRIATISIQNGKLVIEQEFTGSLFVRWGCIAGSAAYYPVAI